MSQSSTPSHIEDLTKDLRYSILRYASLDEVCRIACVNKAVNEMVCSDWLWKDKLSKDWPSAIDYLDSFSPKHLYVNKFMKPIHQEKKMDKLKELKRLIELFEHSFFDIQIRRAVKHNQKVVASLIVPLKVKEWERLKNLCNDGLEIVIHKEGFPPAAGELDDELMIEASYVDTRRKQIIPLISDRSGFTSGGGEEEDGVFAFGPNERRYGRRGQKWCTVERNCHTMFVLDIFFYREKLVNTDKGLLKLMAIDYFWYNGTEDGDETDAVVRFDDVYELFRYFEYCCAGKRFWT